MIRFLWAPWVVAGWLATFALWRSAGISAGRPREEGLREFRVRVGINLMITLLFTVAFWIAGPAAAGPTAPLIIGGGITLVIGVIGRVGKEGRVVAVVSGTLILASAAVLALAHASMHTVGLVGTFVSGGSYFVGGFILTLRG